MTVWSRILCAFGLHRWGRWGDPVGGNIYTKQFRSCECCNQLARRWL